MGAVHRERADGAPAEVADQRREHEANDERHRVEGERLHPLHRARVDQRDRRHREGDKKDQKDLLDVGAGQDLRVDVL